MGGSDLMKYFVFGFVLGVILALSSPSRGDIISVMADEETGQVYPSNVEARLVAVDMSVLVEDIGELQAEFLGVWNYLGLVQTNLAYVSNNYLKADSLFNISNDVSTAFGQIGSLSNSVYANARNIVTNGNQIGSLSNVVMNYSNAMKRADRQSIRIDPANGTATLNLSNRYYYIYAVGTVLTNWAVELPSGNGTVYKVDLNYGTNTPFSWGGSLAACTNLPTPPPAGLSSYVFEIMTDSTNIVAYQ